MKDGSGYPVKVLVKMVSYELAGITEDDQGLGEENWVCSWCYESVIFPKLGWKRKLI